MSSKNLVIACLITFISALLYKIAASDVDIVEQFCYGAVVPIGVDCAKIGKGSPPVGTFSGRFFATSEMYDDSELGKGATNAADGNGRPWHQRHQVLPRERGRDIQEVRRLKVHAP